MGLPLSIIPHLRGETSNGLCLLHDKTFELGLFTLTLDLRVAPNADRIGHSPWGARKHRPLRGATNSPWSDQASGGFAKKALGENRVRSWSEDKA